ncbi:MAG: SEC-C metal-binding domain-containing protein [Arcicella sp.]|nr:SEC-C metal-binding domain-containing protein [Arcicella sp.]
MITYDLDSIEEMFLKIKFEDGQFAGQRIHFDEFSTCGFATCTCYNLHISDGERTFLFQVDEQSVRALAEEDMAFAEAIEAELNDEVWDELYELFTLEKGLECDLIPISKVTNNFSETEYKGVLTDGTMLFYDEVFPHAMDFHVIVDEIEYGLMDLYCLNPSCDCNKVTLQVINDEYEEPLFTVEHNIKHNTFKLDDEEKVIVSNQKVQAILTEIKKEFIEPKIKGISYAERYTRMRTVFKNFLTRRGIPQNYFPGTRLVATIGRNDDCPCGSGKKYKKCCGK